MGHARDHLPHPGEDQEHAERLRIERVYRDYSSDPYYSKIWNSDAARFLVERKWDNIGRALRRVGLDAAAARLLDLGAGSGGDCERFRELGVRPDRIVAIDLLQEFARQARRSHAWLAAVQADGALLPLRDGSFDLVYQSTMLSSVLDRSRRGRILGEVRRVLAPSGLFISYDTRYRNPWNRNTRPVSSSEIREAFPGWTVSSHSTTPIPQLVRFLERLPRWTWRAIETVPPLRSHLLVVARKP
jgi:SAM-dependent methyltransferase